MFLFARQATLQHLGESTDFPLVTVAVEQLHRT